MSCAICGKDNQPGTRFCVHCGAALAPAAVSSAIGGAALTSTTIAGTPTAMPNSNGGASVSTVATRVTSPPPPPPPPEYAVRPAEPAPSVPAYDREPPKSGLRYVVVGVLALVALAAGIGYKIFGGAATDVKDSLSRMESAPRPSVPPPAESAPVVSPPAEPPKAAEPPLPSGEAKDASAPEPAPAPPPKAEAKTAPPRVQVPQPLPLPKAPAAAPTAPVQPPPVAESRPATPAPAATDAQPTTDRWTQFAEELRKCQSEAFLSRVICDQRVRLRYCDGYWNKVPQCPGGVSNPDR